MKRFIFVIALALTLALAFAACGGDDDGKPNNSQTAVATKTSSSNGGDGGDDATDEPTDDSEETDEPTETPDDGGGDDDGNNGGATLPGVDNPCDLLTTDRIAEVMDGRAVVVNEDNSYETACTWDGVDDIGLSVILDIRYGDPDGNLDYYNLDIGDSEDVEGVGEKAHWVDGLGVFEVYASEWEFNIQIIDILGDNTDASKDKGAALSQTVLENLP